MRLSRGFRKGLLGAALCALAAASVGLTAAVSCPVGAQTGRAADARYFPLEPGRSSTFVNSATGEQTTMVVSEGFEGAALVEGIPGLGDQMLTWAGDVLYVWDGGDAQWEPLFRFGDPAGTSYAVRLGTGRWRDVVITVAEKGASVGLPTQGVQLVDGVRFALQFGDGREAGPGEIAFAPGRGIVKLAQNGADGSLELDLTRAAQLDEELPAVPGASSPFELTLRLIPEGDGEFTLEAVTLTPNACHQAGPVRPGAPGGSRSVVQLQTFIFEIEVREGRCAEVLTPVRHRVPNLVLSPQSGRIGVIGFAVVEGRTVATGSAQVAIPTTRR
jgi:hypothetical protein